MALFYTREETEKKKKTLRACRSAAWSIAVMGLAACVGLCLNVRTLNAARMLVATVSVSTLCGWLVIGLYCLGIAPLRADIGHAEGILKGTGETFCGEIHVDPLEFRIPRSISVRKVRLGAGEETIALNVRACCAAQLPPSGTRVRVTAVKSYIVSCEVCHEDD